jgi:formyl-CoA transferase
MGPSVKGVPLWWGVASRNKRCVTMDLKKPLDKRRFETLVAGADIFIENNRPGALDRLGLGWKALSTLNPRLVMLSISGFGQTGPYAPRPGFGKIAEAMSGQVALTGRPTETPFHIGFSLADTTAGMAGLFGIAVAIFLRDKVGRGRGAYVDVGLYEPLLRMLDCQFALRQIAGKPSLRGGLNHPYSWGLFADGRSAIACLRCSDDAWIAVEVGAAAEAALRETLAIEPSALGAYVASQPCDRLLAQFKVAGIGAARIFDGESLSRERYFLDRGDVLTIAYADFDNLTVPGCVPHGYDVESLNVFRAPALGEADAELFGAAAEETA